MTVIAAEVAGRTAAGEAIGSGEAKAGSQLARKRAARPPASRRGGTPAVAQARKVITGTGKSAGPQTRARLTGTPAPSRKTTTTRKRSGHAPHFPKLATAKGAAPKTSTLIVEWLVAVLVIFWGVLDGQTDYVSAMSKALWRVTALSGVFFVLALVMRGKNTGRVAIAFGAIIDLAVIFEAAKNGSIKGLAGVFEGTGTGASKDSTQSEEETVHTLGAGTTLGQAVENTATTHRLVTGKPPQKGTPGAPGTP